MLCKLWKRCALALLAAAAISFSASALGQNDYTLDQDGKTRLPIPVCYEVQSIYSTLSDGSELNNPADLYASADNYLYIADTDNNRIVKLDEKGEFKAEFTCGGTLRSPKGIFVSENGNLFVSDSGNERIVHLNAAGEYIEEFTKPDSEMLEADMDFSVNRLRISNQGYLMFIQGMKFMSVDSKNEFKGYIGSNKLGFSLKRVLVRMFASDEQKTKLLKDEPVAYNSFDVGSDGMIYAVTAEDQVSNQIRKINAVGKNIYPGGVYGEKYFNEHTKAYNSPRFASIAVNNDDIIFVLEQYSGRIYVYDQEGATLCVFGGLGNIKGLFEAPAAITADRAGRIFVLDSGTGYVHVFKPTAFIKHVYSAFSAYNRGEYEEACELWEKVLALNVNYNVANLGYSRCLYKLEKYDEAKYYSKLASSKEINGKAFSESRYLFYQDHFSLVVFLGAIALGLIIFCVIFARKTVSRWRADYYRERMGKL